MTDAFLANVDAISAPSRAPYAVTPHDSNALNPLPKALIAGTAGTIALRGVDGAADVTVTVQAGQLLPIRAAYVRATGTTATSIVALA